MLDTKGKLIEYLVQHTSDEDLAIEFVLDNGGEGSYSLGISGVEQVFDKILEDNITFLRIHLTEQ